MNRPLLWIFIAALLHLSACAETGSNRSSTTNGAAKEFTGTYEELAGTYVGTEVLRGGIFPITVNITADGQIKITDVENISGSAKMDGASFIINRPNPHQVFKGTVSGDTVSGTTYGNVAFGRGTFSATRK